MHGMHALKFWSRTQASVALSSAEAELTAIVKASAETIGLERLAGEAGLKLESGVILTDSSAANGAVHRLGAGKLKHVATSRLWIQERCARGELKFKKVGRESNCADILTHHWDARKGGEMLERMGMYTK